MKNIGIDPKSNFLFKMYYEMHQFDKCEELLKNCLIRKDRYFYEAMFYLFSLYLKNGRYDLAREIFYDMTSNTKRSNELYVRAGHRLEMMENNLYDAVDYTSKILLLDKTDEKILVSKAQLLINIGEYDSAETILNSFNKKNNNVGESNLLYLLMLLEKNDFEAAISYVKKLLFYTIPQKYIDIIQYMVYIINSKAYEMDQKEFLMKFGLNKIEPYYEYFNKEVFNDHIKKHIIESSSQDLWEGKFYSDADIERIVRFAQLDKSNFPTVAYFNDRTVVDYIQDVGIVAGKKTQDFVFIQKYYGLFPITMYPVVLSEEFDRDGFTRIKKKN